MADRDPTFEFWKLMVKEGRFQAAGVENFLHVAGSLGFGQNVKEGVIVEAAYLVNESPRLTCYWVAEIVAMFGYIVQLRFFGRDPSDDPSLDLYRNVGYTRAPRGNQLDWRIHPIGWARRNNKLFRPPPGIDSPANLGELLAARPTLPDNFHEIIELENECCFSPGMIVEVTNVKRIASVMPAEVVRVIGRRIQFRYLYQRRSVWFHEFSHMFFPCGFGRHYDREVVATLPYWHQEQLENEAAVDFFRPILVPDFVVELLRIHRFETGAKLELIDPLEPRYISVGTVVRVLRDHYLEIKIDYYSADDGSDRIYVHAFSHTLLPAGFAEKNGLMEFFRPPHEGFTYENTNTVPPELFRRIIRPHNLRVNQFVEVVGCSSTDLIYVGRIERICGHLARIHFEGYASEEAQFFPISSEDLYPPGWANSVNHRLQTPTQ